MARKKVILRQLERLPLNRIEIEASDLERHQASSLDAVSRRLAETGRSPPLLVLKIAGQENFTLVVGHLRLTAARNLGWQEIDCIVVGEESRSDLAVVERLQRNDFDPWELADTLDRLKRRYGWTQEQVGMAIGKTRDYVANILAITQIAPDVRAALLRDPQARALSTRHLRYVARSNPANQLRVAQRILEQTLSTKELEREKRLTVPGGEHYGLIRVRELRRPGSPNYPRVAKEWRRYHRQLVTDLHRIERQEAVEQRRAQARAIAAKQRLRATRTEATQRRKELSRELRIVKRRMARIGN